VTPFSPTTVKQSSRLGEGDKAAVKVNDGHVALFFDRNVERAREASFCHSSFLERDLWGN